jgi:tripartite ATP-independent transporter DctP family solute receptor
MIILKKEAIKMQKRDCIWRLFPRAIFICILLMGMLSQNVEAQTSKTEKITLKFALFTPESFPYYDGALKFKELVENRTKGKVEVKLFPGGQLGNSRDTLEGILEGIIQIGVGDAVLGNMAPVYNVFSLPLLISGDEHMARTVDGPIGLEIAKRIEQQGGFTVLGWFSTGSATIETRNKPVVKVSDLKGQKIRVMEEQMIVDTLLGLGASPTPMPYGEIYMGLKQGLIDGCIVNLVTVITSRLQEVVKYTTDYRQNPFSCAARPVLMEKKYFSNLPKDIQDAIKESMIEAVKHERSVFATKEKNAMEQLRKEGVTFTQIDYNSFNEKLIPTYDKWTKKLQIEDLVKRIQGIR